MYIYIYTWANIRFIPTRFNRRGQPIDDLLQSSKHLMLLEQNSIMPLDVSLRLRHLLIYSMGLLLNHRSVLLKHIHSSRPTIGLRSDTIVIVWWCHYRRRLTTYPSMRITSYDIDEKLVGHYPKKDQSQTETLYTHTS